MVQGLDLPEPASPTSSFPLKVLSPLFDFKLPDLGLA